MIPSYSSCRRESVLSGRSPGHALRLLRCLHRACAEKDARCVRCHRQPGDPTAHVEYLPGLIDRKGLAHAVVEAGYLLAVSNERLS